MDNSSILFDWYVKTTNRQSEISNKGIEILPPNCDIEAVMKAKEDYMNKVEGKTHTSFIVMVPVLFTGIFE